MLVLSLVLVVLLMLLLLLLLVDLLDSFVNSFLNSLSKFILPNCMVAVRTLVLDVSKALHAARDKTAKPAATAEHHKTGQPSCLTG